MPLPYANEWALEDGLKVSICPVLEKGWELEGMGVGGGSGSTWKGDEKDVSSL